MSMGWMDSSACTLERGLRAEYDRIVGVGARIACGRHADQRQSRCSVEYVLPESASYKSLYCPFVLDRRSIRVQRVCAKKKLLSAQNQESWPNRAHTRGNPATPQKLAQEVRDSSTFMLVQLSPHNQCGTNPNNLPRHTLVPLSTDWAHTTVHQ